MILSSLTATSHRENISSFHVCVCFQWKLIDRDLQCWKKILGVYTLVVVLVEACKTGRIEAISVDQHWCLVVVENWIGIHSVAHKYNLKTLEISSRTKIINVNTVKGDRYSILRSEVEPPFGNLFVQGCDERLRTRVVFANFVVRDLFVFVQQVHEVGCDHCFAVSYDWSPTPRPGTFVAVDSQVPICAHLERWFKANYDDEI